MKIIEVLNRGIPVVWLKNKTKMDFLVMTALLIKKKLEKDEDLLFQKIMTQSWHLGTTVDLRAVQVLKNTSHFFQNL